MLLRNLALWPDCLYFAFFPMKILGIDFTSRPGRGKPLICVECEFAGNQLAPHALRKWESFQGFEAALAQPGPWVAGIDFPFGQSGKFVRNIGWPASWADYVDHVASMSREQFRQLQPESSTRRHVPVNLRRRRHRRQPRRPLLRHPGQHGPGKTAAATTAFRPISIPPKAGSWIQGWQTRRPEHTETN